jgi:hypothetical protein
VDVVLEAVEFAKRAAPRSCTFEVADGWELEDDPTALFDVIHVGAGGAKPTTGPFFFLPLPIFTGSPPHHLWPSLASEVPAGLLARLAVAGRLVMSVNGSLRSVDKLPDGSLIDREVIPLVTSEFISCLGGNLCRTVHNQRNHKAKSVDALVLPSAALF